MTPTRDMIEERALELWQREHREVTFIHPEPEELREGGYWLRAQRDLMSSGSTLAREELSKARYDLTLELRRVEEALGEKALDQDVKVLLEGFEERLKALEAKSNDKALAAELLGLYLCRRCGHPWVKRQSTEGDPGMCPRCKSRLWKVSKT